MVARGLSERRTLTVGRMSASAFRYVPRPDGNAVVRDRIVDLAQRHQRYRAGMIYLKLRQAGHIINHKRVDRLYSAIVQKGRTTEFAASPAGEPPCYPNTSTTSATTSTVPSSSVVSSIVPKAGLSGFSRILTWRHEPPSEAAFSLK